jgi:hypothetical protein
MTEFAMGSDTYGVGAGEALSLTSEAPILFREDGAYAVMNFAWFTQNSEATDEKLYITRFTTLESAVHAFQALCAVGSDFNDAIRISQEAKTDEN